MRVILTSFILSLAMLCTPLWSQQNATENTTKTVTFTVKGMTCGGCVAKVKKAALSVDGVLDCDVSLEKGTAKVRFNPQKVDHKTILAALQKTDYAVSLGTDNNNAESVAPAKKKAGKKHVCNSSNCCKSKDK